MQWREWARYDAGRQFYAAANRGIVSFGDKIDLSRRELPVRANVRIACQKRREERDDIVGPKIEAHADLEHACRLASIRGDI
jgi:hypothetical protein